MPLVANGKNLALNALRGVNPTTPITHASLHSATPNASGSNEISGGSPAYARQAVTFNAADGDSITMAAAVTFNVPAGATVAFAGFWSASTSGTFLGYGALTSETFTGQGQYVLNPSDVVLNDS